MVLSPYHQKMANNSDEELIRHKKAKEDELKFVFGVIQPTTQKYTLRVAILGCADKRYIASHKELFERLLQKSVELDTYDISIEHLEGEENVFQHDCTEPLPKTDYDITFAQTKEYGFSAY